jgi:hypothetical protein
VNFNNSSSVNIYSFVSHSLQETNPKVLWSVILRTAVTVLTKTLFCTFTTVQMFQTLDICLSHSLLFTDGLSHP